MQLSARRVAGGLDVSVCCLVPLRPSVWTCRVGLLLRERVVDCAVASDALGHSDAAYRDRTPTGTVKTHEHGFDGAGLSSSQMSSFRGEWSWKEDVAGMRGFRSHVHIV